MRRPYPHGFEPTVDFPLEDEDVLAQLTPKAVRAVFTALDAASAIPEGPSPHPLMHRHETVDYGLVLDGALVLVLDGSETPARMAFILIDGTYAAELKPG